MKAVKIKVYCLAKLETDEIIAAVSFTNKTALLYVLQDCLSNKSTTEVLRETRIDHFEVQNLTNLAVLFLKLSASVITILVFKC